MGRGLKSRRIEEIFVFPHGVWLVGGKVKV